jgi:hypothetical protein
VLHQAKYFEEYWGQRLGRPPPPPVRGTSQADIEAELPPLTPTNQAQLAFSYSAREPHHQKPLQSPQRHASPAAHSASNHHHHRLPGGSSSAYDAEAVPPRKRKLEPSSSLEDRATVHSGPPSPAEDEWQRQPRKHAEGHEEDDVAYMDDEAAAGGKPGSLTKRRRVRSTTALPEGGSHPESASADYHRVMSGRSGSGSGASPSSSSRTRYVSSSANGRASSHLPPKKSHKQNVGGGGGHRPRASSSSSSPTVNSTRQTEQEILEEFNLSEGGGLDYEADVVDDEPNSDVSPRGAKKRAAADRDPRRRKEREKREGSVAAAGVSAAGGVKKKGSGGSGSSGGGGGGGVKLKDPASGNDLTSGASFRRGAEIILKREGKPMDAREIVRVGLKEGFCPPPPHIYIDAVARSDGELT